MPTSVEAVVDEIGRVRLLEAVRYASPRRAIVTILDEPSSVPIDEDVATEPRVLPWTAKYEPIRQIGKGGMSVVHLARDRRTGAVVCIKELQDSARRSTLQQECRALARLRHPGILRLFNFEARGDHPYLVMEYGPGGSLNEYIRTRHLAQQPLALVVAQRLFDAVAAAHDETVIHRDLKPANVLVDAVDGSLWPRILDFGLAVVDHFDDGNAISAIGAPAGTWQYMAPEQMEGRRLTGACDVYAVGQMCWEMLAGGRAFSGSIPEIAAAKMSRDGLPLTEPLLHVESRVADFIRSCTRRRPEDRPSARAASDALRGFTPTLPSQARLVPSNLSVRRGRAGSLFGWFDGLGYVDNTSMWYSSRVEAEPNGPSHLRLERREAHADEFGVLMQRVPAAHLAGTRVRFAAFMRTEQVERRAGFWLRADGEDQPTLSFDNMRHHPVSGTTGWTPYSVEIDLPPLTAWLNFGLLLYGAGAMCVRNIELHARSRAGVWLPLGLPELMTGGAQDIPPDQLT
jgi:serine/threonine protein kinase